MVAPTGFFQYLLVVVIVAIVVVILIAVIIRVQLHLSRRQDTNQSNCSALMLSGKTCKCIRIHTTWAKKFLLIYFDGVEVEFFGKFFGRRFQRSAVSLALPKRQTPLCFRRRLLGVVSRL
jgi:hypothetical protein